MAEYDYKGFKQWVSELPIGNVSKTARALYDELDRLNRLEISPVERFGALELLLPSMGYVLEKLHGYFATKSIPLSKENRLVARLHLELLVSIILGYKTVLAQFHDDSLTGYLLHKRTRSEASRRVLYFLGEVLLHEYSIYRSSPKYVWKEIHGVYYYAVQNDLQYKEVDAPDNGLCGCLSLKDLYKRILLFAVAIPNCFLKGEVRKVNDAIVRWLPQAVLVSINDDVSISPVFLIDAQKDAPPCPADVCDKEHMKIGWILITADLDKVLEQEISAMQGSAPAQLRPMDAVSIRLMSKLRDAWGRALASREERKKKSDVIEVAYGLMSLYQLFGGEQLAQTAAGKQNSASYTVEAKEVGQVVAAIAHDEFIIDAGAELSTGFSSDSERAHEELVELDIINSASVDEIKSVECISVDESEKGYYLTWPGESEYRSHVGELIGVNSREDLDLGGTWSLGIIRWAGVRNNGLMGFGIELLAGDIEPVRVERWYDNDSKADILLGFQQMVNGKVESILTYPFYTGNKDRFVLVKKDERLPIIPDQILECTDAIMRFTTKIDPDAIGAAETDSKKYSASDDLFNIAWDDLKI